MKPSSNPSSDLSGRLEMIAAMALSGTIGYFVVESGQSTWNVVFFRCLFGAMGLFAYCWARGLLAAWPFSTRTLFLTLLSGAAIVLNWVLLFSSYGHASISIATAVYNTQPFFLILLGFLLFGERPTADALGFIAVAFMGLVMVTQVESGAMAWTGGYLAGLAQALGAAFLYAVASVIVKRLKGLPPHLIALVQAILGTAMLLPLADFSGLPGGSMQWGYLLILGLVHTCIMYILLYSAFQKLDTTKIAVLSFIYPAVSLFIDYLIYHTRLTPAQGFGVALIFLSSIAVNRNWNFAFVRPKRRALS